MESGIINMALAILMLAGIPVAVYFGLKKSGIEFHRPHMPKVYLTKLAVGLASVGLIAIFFFVGSILYVYVAFTALDATAWIKGHSICMVLIGLLVGCRYGVLVLAPFIPSDVFKDDNEALGGKE